MNDAEFAAQQQFAMGVRQEDLLPVITRALGHYEDGDVWATPVLDRAALLFEGASGYPAGTEFRNRLRNVLLKTNNPDDTPGDTAARLASWISTYITNAAEYLAGESGPKTWITRHDDRVRSAHEALNGVMKAAGDRFDVGTAMLRYPGEPVGDPAGWIACRCVLRGTKEKDMTLVAAGPAHDIHRDGENVVPTADPADVPATDGPEDENGPAVDDETLVPFHGVATVTDRPTGDRRQLASTGYGVRPLPLPVFYQRAQSEGHGGSTTVGQFTRMELNDAGEVEYDGFFNYTPEAAEAIQGVAEGWLRGVSVDLDDMLVDYAQPSALDAFDGDEEADPAELMDAMQREVTVFSQWRVAGLTIVGIPAFHEAYIRLGPRPVEDPNVAALQAEETAMVAAAFAPGTHDGPGWITSPVPTGRIRRYWTHGEGAAKIGWGVPGDFNRCRTHLSKYIANQEWLAGTCANMHKEATGGWPGSEDGSHAIRNSLVASGAKMAEAFSLVASAAPTTLPARAAFQDPQLTGPTPITIEGDRIFGHIATWGTCHIGFGGTCTEAPHSNTNYSWFRLGAIETDDGLVPVGQITLGTGHASLQENARSAAAHYDNTGSAVADIATGEDEHGIWFAGVLRPGISAEQRRELLGAKLSGDWREIRNNLELVAALAVNTPGFGIPRLGLAASGAAQTALVAAGIVDVPVVVELSLDDRVNEAVARALAARDRREGLAARTAGLRALAAERRAQRLASARARPGR